MGKQNFWREKNANLFVGEKQIITPTKNELLKCLAAKFEEKIAMIDVIFDKEARQNYLTKKNKTIPQGTPEIKVQQKIASRVLPDLLQLVNDFCSYFSVKLQDTIKANNLNSIAELKASLATNLNRLTVSTQESLENIYADIFFLVEQLKLDIKALETERKAIEEKEGSFFNGKIVIM